MKKKIYNKPEQFLSVYHVGTKYPGFHHHSYNFRIGKVKAKRIQIENKLGFQTRRSLKLSLHFRFGRSLLGLRPEIEWNRKRSF